MATQYNINDYKHELRLTIDNTEDLYNQAKAVQNLDWESEEIDSLYTATWAQINRNAGENVAPTLYTDLDVKKVKEAVVSAVVGIQNEIKERIEYLRSQVRDENIGYSEIVELQELAPFIDPSDTELLEWAGVPEGER